MLSCVVNRGKTINSLSRVVRRVGSHFPHDNMRTCFDKLSLQVAG